MDLATWSQKKTFAVEALVVERYNLSPLQIRVFQTNRYYFEILDAANDGWWKTVENMLSEEGIRFNGVAAL